ncbi:MAG: ABC transporter ATP-binding protein [Acetatifactor sp.]|nr:ABC transporter ATP-binding protein [Acetatifactor sp.]
MRIQDILKKNGLWILLSSLCSLIISRSIIVGTDIITEQMDVLITLGTLNIAKILWVVLPAITIATIASFVESKCIGKYSVKVIKETQDMIARKILHVKNKFWIEESSGKLLAKMTSDMNEVEKFASDTLPNLIKSIISIVMVAFFVAGKNIYMLLITAGLYPVIIVIMTFWGNILKRLAQKRRGNIDSMVEQVVDCVGGIDIVKSYNLAGTFIVKIENSIGKILDNEYKRAWIMHFSQTLQRFLFCIPNMICPITALLFVLRGDITIGEMTAYIVLVNKIVSNMKQLPFLITDAKEKRVSIDRLNQIMGAPVREDKSAEPVYGDRISMENVSFGYIEGQNVLKNVNLYLEQNKTYAFVGLLGQGKSTLFKLLSGLEDEYTGKCNINKNCAIVPQNAFLFNGTIEENIGIGRAGATKEDIVNAAIAAGIHDKIVSLENQYNTVVGEKGVGLSGGEKQRICIARALVSGADVLLLDEPTASVDAETEKIIMNTLRQLSGKKTIILISHRLSLIKDADKIFVVDDGRIEEQGRHEELIVNDRVYKELWKMEVCDELS